MSPEKSVSNVTDHLTNALLANHLYAGTVDERQIHAIISAFCDITDPEEEYTIEVITPFSAGAKGGVTRKPGNIVLN